MKIRDLLEDLPNDTLVDLCRRRGLRAGRLKTERCSALARSYRGDFDAFLPDLQRQDLETILDRPFYFGPHAYRLRRLTGRRREDLLRLAQALLVAEEQIPELARSPEEDLEPELRSFADDDPVLQILGLLEMDVLLDAADALGLPRSLARRKLVQRLRNRLPDDPVEMLRLTQTKEWWNDLIEGLGGSRRRSFDDIAGELQRMLRVDDGERPERSTPPEEPPPDPAAPAAQKQVRPAARVAGATSAQLLADDASLLTAFQAACGWAEEITLCAPAFDTNEARSPLWQALVPHLGKVERAYVGLDGLRTDPTALAALYRRGSLRVLMAADASVRAHLWRFTRDGACRILQATGPFGGCDLVAPVTAAVLWEGTHLDPFALSASRVLERARSHAFLPNPSFLDGYRSLLDFARPHGEAVLEAAASRYLRHLGLDAATAELTLIRDEDRARRAVERLRENLTGVGTRVPDQQIQGVSERTSVYWVPGVSLWCAFGDLPGGGWHLLGTNRPRADGLEPLLRLDIAYPPRIDAPVDLAEDGQGGRYLVSREPSARSAVGFTVVASIDGPSCVRELAAHVHERRRRRAHAQDQGPGGPPEPGGTG